MSSEDSLMVQRAQTAVARIVLNRPEKLNTLHLSMWKKLSSEVERLSGVSELAVIVLTGKGKQAFSAGADISEFPEVRSNSAEAREYSRHMNAALAALQKSSKVILASIDGHCVGGGLELAASCDLRVATFRSRFGIPVARIGVLAGWLELKRLIQTLGYSRTVDLLFTGRLMDVEEASRSGFVSHVVEASCLKDHVDELCQKIVEGSSQVHSIHKQMLAVYADNPGLQNLTPDEADLCYQTFGTRDFHERIQDFLRD